MKIANLNSAPKLRFTLISWLMLSLGACQAQIPSANAAIPATGVSTSSNNSEAVQKLVKKTLSQLSFIEGGKFMLGDEGGPVDDNGRFIFDPIEAKKSKNKLSFTSSPDNKPAVPVSLDSYYLMQYKVTYDDFDVFVAANNLSKHPPEGNAIWQQVWQDARSSGDVPAGVNWQQAKDYCLWLGKVSGLPFDLPTESQWEYAARNKGKSIEVMFITDNGKLEVGRNIPTFEWEKQNVGKNGALYPIGKFPPSPLKLYDMEGDGLDWVKDWYSNSLANNANKHNPTGASEGTEKVLRGGLQIGGGGKSGWRYLLRSHRLPTGATLESEPYPYTKQNARCVINQSHPFPANGL